MKVDPNFKFCKILDADYQQIVDWLHTPQR